MRAINYIVVHHSASPRTTTAAEIEKWHRAKGWQGIGYHYVIEGDGHIEIGRLEEIVGAHVEGHNKDSIGICVVGDNTKPEQSWTPKQVQVLYSLLVKLHNKYPKAQLKGHRDFKPTECPGRADWRELLTSQAAQMLFWFGA